MENIIVMNLCFVVNNAYVNVLIVLLTSIFDNTSEFCNCYVLTKNMGVENRCKLFNFVGFHYATMNIIDVDDSNLEGVPLKRKDFDKTPYYKLLFAEYLPKTINKILYMDVDMIVNKDISLLYNIDISSYVLAAVPDPLVNVRDKEYLKKMNVNIEAGERYFNSGLILFNLDYLRKKYNIDIALRYICIHGATFKFHDQEVLNGLFLKEYLQLEQKFNYLTVYRGILDLVRYISGIQRKTEKEIAIFHYANPTKPWKRNYIGKYEIYFWKYARLSPVYYELKKNEKNSILEQINALLNIIRRRIKL